MHLTNAVSVVVPRPLPLGVAGRGVAAAHRGEPVVPAPLIGVDRDHRPTRTPHDPLQRRPSECSTTVRRTCPLSRPTTPQTGGRSFSQLPWPGALLARRRGGSSGSRCGTPSFPVVLVRLVGLQDLVIQCLLDGAFQSDWP